MFYTAHHLHHFPPQIFFIITMSKSIFASLENINLMAELRSSSPSVPETPSVGQKRPIPQEFESENSQPFRPFSFSSVSHPQTPAPIPSFSSMNVASTMRQYLSQKNASVSDTEEVLKYIRVRY